MKNIIKSLCIFLILSFFNSIVVFAEPKEMDNGIIFDAEFYANTYEDIKNIFGYDENLLYKHYLEYGIYEGRLAYEEDTSVNLSYQILGNCKNINTMNSYVSKIPDNFKSFLINNGWTIYLTDEEIAQTEFNGAYKSVMGATNYIEKYIKIEDRTNAIEQSILHEIGHAIDFNSGYSVYSSTEEFLNLYNLEKNAFSNVKSVRQHGVSNAFEYFAESIQQYIIHPDNFRENCPNTYLYIENVFNSL